MTPARTFRISPDVLSQQVHGETVLLDLVGEAYFGLNEVGSRIWELLQAGHDAGAIVDALEREFDAPRPRLQEDLSALLTQLAEAGLIRAGEGEA